MRRFVFWYLPAGVGLAAVLLFGFGFVSYLRGDRGTPVEFLARIPAAQANDRAVVRAVLVGDSLARGTGDEAGFGIGGHLDAELKRRGVRAERTYNFAVNGARTKDLLLVLERENVRQLLSQANVIVISIGGNDLWGGTDWRNAAPPDPDATMNEVLERIEQAVKSVREASPQARVFFIGLYNPFASTPGGPALGSLVGRWNARLMERFGSDPNFMLVPTADLFSHRDRLSVDRFHPGGEGYTLIARRIADAL